MRRQVSLPGVKQAARATAGHSAALHLHSNAETLEQPSAETAAMSRLRVGLCLALAGLLLASCALADDKHELQDAVIAADNGVRPCARDLDWCRCRFPESRLPAGAGSLALEKCASACLVLLALPFPFDAK